MAMEQRFPYPPDVIWRNGSQVAQMVTFSFVVTLLFAVVVSQIVYVFLHESCSIDSMKAVAPGTATPYRRVAAVPVVARPSDVCLGGLFDLGN